MFSSIKSLSLLASLVSAAAIAETGLVARQTTCAAGLHLMIAGGCAIPCLADVPSLLSTLIGNLTERFPGTDQYYVPYNNVASQAQISTPVMIAAAKQYAADCPTTPIVFIGYSLGGIIIMNTLCGGLSTQYVPNVLAAITYGEETYRYPMSYDAGTCTTLAPNYPRNNTDLCAPYAPVIQDICSSTDPNCCKGGLDAGSHYTYPQFYDLQMLAYVEAKYAALQATKTSTTSTASSTSTSTTVSTVSTAVSTTVSTTVTASTTTVASSASTTTVATSASTTSVATGTTTTVATGTTTSVATGTTTTVATGTTTTVATGASTATSTASTRSTITIVSTVSTASTTTVRFSNSSTSSATGTASVSVITGAPSTTTTTIYTVVTTFPDIPNSAILVASSVLASYLPSIVTAVPSGSTYVPSGTASVSATSRTTAGAATTTTGSATRTTAAVTAYTGAATRATGIAFAAVAGLAMAAIAI